MITILSRDYVMPSQTREVMPRKEGVLAGGGDLHDDNYDMCMTP